MKRVERSHHYWFGFGPKLLRVWFDVRYEVPPWPLPRDRQKWVELERGERRTQQIIEIEPWLVR